MLEGITTSVKEVHPENILVVIFVKPLPNVIPVSHVHPLKALSPISVTLEGISTLFNDRQPMKAFRPILVTVEGMFTYFNDEHPLKALSPIEITLFMVTDLSTVFPLHTPIGKDVKMFENTTSTALLSSPNNVVSSILYL